jgi:hypothetical protein
LHKLAWTLRLLNILYATVSKSRATWWFTIIGIGNLAALVGAIFTVAIFISQAVQSRIDAKVNELLPMSKTSLSDMLNTLKSDDLTIKDWLKNMPVGTVLPYALPVDSGQLYDRLPRNWVLCDGRAIDSKHPRAFGQGEVDPAYWNKSVPDLTGRVLRGAVKGEVAGNLGGKDSVSGLMTTRGGAHVHEIPAHDHHIGGLTGSIANDGPDPGFHAYKVLDDNDKWKSENFLSTNGRHAGAEG